MPDEEQRANHEVTQGKQKPPSKSLAKPRYGPAYWVTFVLLMLAIIAIEWLFIGRGTIMVVIGPIVACLLASVIASRLFPPRKEEENKETKSHLQDIEKEKLIDQCKQDLVTKSERELLNIWKKGDKKQYSEEELEAVRQILNERGHAFRMRKQYEP